MLDTQYNESLYYVKYIKSYRRIITQKISKQQLNRHTSTIVLLLIYCQKHQQKSTPTFPCNPALICYSQRFVLGVISTFWQWKHYIQQEAMKNNTQTKTIEELAYRYKKIKDYVYDMQSVLGKGNFSTVYRGRNQDKNEEIAVKVVKMSSLTFQKLQQLLQQEIITTRMLNHPNTIRCYEVLKSVNHCYFITELCQGGTLEKLLKRKGTLKQEDAWPYIRDIYQGLKYLNSKNIIHRDIKAANIFIKSGVAKIADFGFAIQTKQHFKDINIGSPLYMSPEGLCDNIYGPKTDVWAFGLVIYELLHGKAPLAHAATQQQLQNLLKVQLRVDQLRPDLSPDMKQLILRCLEVDQQKRIAMGQIQKLPYIQNNYFPKVMTCISLNNTRYRRLSGPNSNMLLVPQQNFYKTSVRTITNLENKQNKENFRPKNERQCQKSCSVKLIATARRIQKVPSDEIESNTSITLDYRQRDMIIANITFNQAIGMIHYCRIGFKLAQENISCQLKKWIKSLVLMILQEIKIKLNSDQIQYVDDHNRERKESKLKLVVNEYLSKYCKEMQGEKAQVVLPHLQDSLKKKLAQLQKRGDENINLLYLTMLFTIFTQALAKATQCKNYKFFGQTGVVDTSLQVKNIPLCYESYERSRKIYQHHFQNVFCTVKQ